MNSLRDFALLNPFGRNSIGENEMWAEGQEIFCDVESINRNCFQELSKDLDEIGRNHETRLRFVIGAPGTGKSHLFARLRRSLPNAHFTFAPILPTEPCEIKRYILKKVIFGLKRPVLEASGIRGYSQIVRLVYSLLTRIPRFRALSAEQVHKNWRQIPRIQYARVFEEFQEALDGMPGIEIPYHILRVLFRILDPEKRALCLTWLSGTKSLMDGDHGTLGVNGPLDDSEIVDLFKVLGKLSRDSGPILMVLDQLDALTRPEQIREIETLLVDLKDNSVNWYIVVSLLEEKFQLWCTNLSEPCLQKFGIVENGKSVFRVSSVSMISREQQVELLLKRLGEPNLNSCRASHNKIDAIFPFIEATVERLTSQDFTRPRVLLQLAEQEFQTITTERQANPKSLSELMEREFLELLGRLKDDEIKVDTAFVADRITELMQLIGHGKQEWQVIDGPLRMEIKRFEGIDRIYERGKERIRIVNYDVQQGAKFPNVLRHIVRSTRETVLVRDARVPCSGEVTQRLLNEFRQTKTFVHLSLKDVRALHVLGHLLARVRQGDYQNDLTEPAPTRDNIQFCLSRMDWIARIEIAHLIQEVLEGKETGRPSPPPPPGPEDLCRQIEAIMRVEGWLSYERLFFRIYTHGRKRLSREILSAALRSEPLGSLIDIYPKEDVFPEHNRILIWNQETINAQGRNL
ncbi:MAG: hypothetical protein HY912_17560 [Desulfomonile tiedjei]|uniref:Orc1-like AAA ATPase domain-containing protein n=1 Tax=Desulfomonile tiedjei TaxID=2358 RepID=A0A9D6V4B8_9BACT|nr:hypothetical protein [Desulfomonile tiedjei]